MRRQLIVIVVLAFLLGGRACAIETDLPQELERLAPEVADLIESDGESGYGFFEGMAVLLGEAFSNLKPYLVKGIRSVAVISAGVILLGAVESLGGNLVARHSNLIGALYVTTVTTGDIGSLIGMGRETVERLSVLSKTLIPALAAATAATGGINSAAVRQAATVLFADIMLTVIDGFLIPALYIYIAAASANAVLENGALETIALFIKKTIGWILGGAVTLFTAYISIAGAIAGSADAQAVRAAKAAVSTAVPLVGGIFAEAAEALLVGAGILRATIGVFGMLAVLAGCLLPFLRLGGQYLLYQGAVLVAQAAGPKNLSKLLGMLADAFSLMLAMTGTSALLLIISTVSAMTVVTS